MRERLKAAQSAGKGYRLRSFVGKMVNLRDEGNVYGEKLEQEKLDGILTDLVDAEFIRHSILGHAGKAAVSCKEIAGEIGVDPSEVLRHVVVLRRRNLLELDRIDGRTPMYRAAGGAEK